MKSVISKSKTGCLWGIPLAVALVILGGVTALTMIALFIVAVAVGAPIVVVSDILAYIRAWFGSLSKGDNHA